MDKKISVGAVSYLNTKPLIHGILTSPVSEEVELVLDHPANLAERLKQGRIDMGLVPVGALPTIPGARVVSDHCIGTEGEVASVAVFSEVPLEGIRKIWLDYQSRTSVRLCRLIFDRHLRRSDIEYLEARDEGYIESIKGDTAGLVIGDRALRLNRSFPHLFDLGSLWREFTGLPFVFACWVACRDLDPSFIGRFNEANRHGIEAIDQVVEGIDFPYYDLERYFKSNMSYTLDDAKREGMRRFLDML